MTCPRCQEGMIVTVVMKTTGEIAHLCDTCETFWLEGEAITSSTGHFFHVLSQGKDKEYVLEDAQDLDQEHRSIRYVTWR